MKTKKLIWLIILSVLFSCSPEKNVQTIKLPVFIFKSGKYTVQQLQNSGDCLPFTLKQKENLYIFYPVKINDIGINKILLWNPLRSFISDIDDSTVISEEPSLPQPEKNRDFSQIAVIDRLPPEKIITVSEIKYLFVFVSYNEENKTDMTDFYLVPIRGLQMKRIDNNLLLINNNGIYRGMKSR